MNILLQNQYSQNHFSQIQTPNTMKTLLHSVFLRITLVVLMLNFISVNKSSAAFPAGGGNYTIDNVNVLTAYSAGGATGNFTTFTAAIAELNASSAVTLTGPITFTVTTAQTFSEVFSGLSITYTNPGNQLITFVSSNTSSTNPILSGKTGTTAADAVLTITSGKFYTFNHIDLKNDASNATILAEMEIGLNLSTCNNITFQNGAINLTYALTETNATNGIKMSAGGTGFNFSNNTITINPATGASFGINGTTLVSSTFDNNTINISGTHTVASGIITLTGLSAASINNTISNNNSAQMTMTGAVNWIGINIIWGGE